MEKTDENAIFSPAAPRRRKTKEKRVDNGFSGENSPPLGGEKIWGAKKKDWRCRQFGAAHRREPKVARKKNYREGNRFIVFTKITYTTRESYHYAQQETSVLRIKVPYMPLFEFVFLVDFGFEIAQIT